MSNRIRRLFEFTAIHIPILEALYWQTAPMYYRWKIKPEVTNISIPIQPFDIHYVSPTDIDRFSGIQGEAAARANDIGDIKPGEWDRSIEALDRSPITAERLSETVLFHSMKEHFDEDVPWEQTDLIHAVKNTSFDQPLWHNCQSIEDVLHYCQSLDELYETIRTEGYRTQFDVVRNTKGLRSIESAGFLNALINEVTVDVARDGTLLLADGRHRLAIAKLIGLDTIPVVILARHQKWIENLQNTSELDQVAHPDSKYLQNLII